MTINLDKILPWVLLIPMMVLVFTPLFFLTAGFVIRFWIM